MIFVIYSDVLAPLRYMFIHRWNLSGSIWQSIKKTIIAAIRHSMVEHGSADPKFGPKRIGESSRSWGRMSWEWKFKKWLWCGALKYEGPKGAWHCYLKSFTPLNQKMPKSNDEDEDDGNDKDKLDASAVLWSILVAGCIGCIGKRKSCQLHKSLLHMKPVTVLLLCSYKLCTGSAELQMVKSALCCIELL